MKQEAAAITRPLPRSWKFSPSQLAGTARVSFRITGPGQRATERVVVTPSCWAPVLRDREGVTLPTRELGEYRARAHQGHERQCCSGRSPGDPVAALAREVDR